jgi:hypothetical protein
MGVSMLRSDEQMFYRRKPPSPNSALPLRSHSTAATLSPNAAIQRAIAGSSCKAQGTLPLRAQLDVVVIQWPRDHPDLTECPEFAIWAAP